jgi:hypothetical protein
VAPQVGEVDVVEVHQRRLVGRLRRLVEALRLRQQAMVLSLQGAVIAAAVGWPLDRLCTTVLVSSSSSSSPLMLLPIEEVVVGLRAIKGVGQGVVVVVVCPRPRHRRRRRHLQAPHHRPSSSNSKLSGLCLSRVVSSSLAT